MQHAEEWRPSTRWFQRRCFSAFFCQVPTGALPRSLIENAAITLGRIAWTCPEPLAPHAAAFLGPW